MKIDYDYLSALRSQSPAWKLLCADNAPLLISFLNRVFIETNARVISEQAITEKLEDELYFLREEHGADSFPRSASEYLRDWSDPGKGWLRRFYAKGSDDPCFDLTPSAEKAITWLLSLTHSTFVGTESRLKIIFELLRQIAESDGSDPEEMAAELSRRRDAINAEIAKIKSGSIITLDDTAVKDRFQQFSSMARELLSDFREVEYNFRALDRNVRRRIAVSTAGKGEILDDVLGRSDSIEESDQGKSFRAFTDFLLSSEKQEELQTLLRKVFSLSVVEGMNYDRRLVRISDNWLEASDHALATMRQLSAQLRQFLDGRVWLENRRIIQILQNITRHAIDSDIPRDDDFMELETPGLEVNLIMERPLYLPAEKTSINSKDIVIAGDSGDTDSLFEQFFVDRAVLEENIRTALIGKSQVTLADVVSMHPVERGLAEVVTYMDIAAKSDRAFFNEDESDEIFWTGGDGRKRSATMPRVIFTKQLTNGGAGNADR